MISSVSGHVPILAEPITEALHFVRSFLELPDSAPAHAIVDCTLGGWGHTAEVFARISREFQAFQASSDYCP